MAVRNSPLAKYLPILAIMSAVVMVSGCTGTGDSVSFGQGVIITGFESDLGNLNLESGDDVGLMLRVQNKGELDAIDVEAQLLGIDLDEWGTGFSWSGETQRIGDLIAADSSTNTEGQTATVQWALEAPDLPQGTEFSYEPRVRVLYDYQTKAIKPITLVDVAELRRIIQQGKSLSAGTTRTSSGPFSIQIRTGDFVKTQNYDDPFPLNIFITNDLWESGGSVIQGSGFYGGFGGSSEFQYPVKVKLNLPDGMSLSGSGQGCSTSGEWVNLWKGKSAELTCEISISDPPEYREDKLIQVELEYRFFIDAATTLRVIGTEDSNYWR